MGYIDFCSKCKYAYTEKCKSNSIECLQEKARLMLEINNKNIQDGENNG